LDLLLKDVVKNKGNKLTNKNLTTECECMKILSKAIIIGIISFAVFLFGNFALGAIIGLFIPGGDDFMNSYFYPLYTATTILLSLVISSTYLIVKKINLLLEKMEEC
jgi:hypothetical protein